MYIHKTYHLVEPNLPIATYKKTLSSLCKINLRRANKFNILSVYGALSCIESTSISDNIGIYLATEYGPVESLKNVVEQVNNPQGIVMPFDFLGINTSASFYIAQALNASGKHMVLTAHNLSFEKALQLAYFDLMHHEVEDVLIGRVDASLSFIENHQSYITPQSVESFDQSYWFYANRNSQNALAKIEKIEEFSSIETMREVYGTQMPTSFYALLTQDANTKDRLLHIAKDDNGKCIVIEMEKL